MSRILITGGAGFIGSHTADALLRQGHQVRILDRLDPQVHGSVAFPSYIDAAVECLQGDVRVAADVDRALKDIDVVYHFAALTGVGQSMYDLRDYVDTNCVGTATLIEAIVKKGLPIQKLILASSRAVYGEGTHACPKHGVIYPSPRQRYDLEQGRFDLHCPNCNAALSARPTCEARPLMPMSVYAWTKKQQEDYCQYAAHTYDLPVTVLRYFNVYGSRQSLNNPYTGVVSIFYNRIKAVQPISLYEHGQPGRDFVHVSDVVQANLQALEHGNERYNYVNVGAGIEHTITDVAVALGRACGRAPELQDHGEFRVGDIRSCYADLTAARQVLGYAPTVSLEAGMQEFVAWADDHPSADQYQKTVEELRQYGLFGRACA